MTSAPLAEFLAYLPDPAHVIISSVHPGEIPVGHFWLNRVTYDLSESEGNN